MARSDINPCFWSGKRVFVTGHSVFKGGWLALWLHALGAEVHGYALPSEEGPGFFAAAALGDCLASHTLGDFRDSEHLAQTLSATQPDILIHMAAQSLVRLSYDDPVETVSTKVLDTAVALS